MSLAKTAFHSLLQSLGTADAIRRHGHSARNAGVTTLTDLGTTQTDDEKVIDTFKSVVNDEAFPARLLVPYSNGFSKRSLEEQAKHGLDLAEHNSGKIRFSHVKLSLDGSNQGFTGQILWPGYYKGEDHGSG